MPLVLPHTSIHSTMKKAMLLICLSTATLFAQPKQVEPDSIALVEDKYTALFYESLKQKGIENYDRAIDNLQQALVLKPKEAVLYHEIGRNYLFQKKYVEAETYILKAIDQEATNKYFYLSLYDVYYQTKNYPESIKVVQKLIGFNDKRKLEFQDDLVSLYMYTHQFDKALALIEELEQQTSNSKERDLYKLQILKDKLGLSDISSLEAEIKKNPKNEQAYISLIYQYSEQNQEDKAFEVAKLLAKNIPSSEWAQVSLFKYYLEDNQTQKAISAMEVVLESTNIDAKIKHRILNEFLIFVSKNPEYNNQLQKAISYFKNDTTIDVSREVGKFFFNKQSWKEAAEHFENSLSIHPNDLETLLLLLRSYTEMGNFDVISVKAPQYIEVFPMQPELYYYNGLAQNQLKDYKKAKNTLLEAIDYLIDDKPLEINFYIQLVQAYQGLGDEKAKNNYLKKIESLTKTVSK